MGTISYDMTNEEIKNIAANIAKVLTDAWNAGDGSAYAEAFTDDAVFVNVFGEILITKQQIAIGHQLILDHPFKGTTINYSLIDAEQIDTNTILSHNHGSMPVNGDPGGLTMTLIITKQNERWLIRVLHNTTIVENPYIKHIV